MRKLKLFLSMLMLIAFSVGNVWATDAASVELCTSWSQTFAYATAYTHDYSIDDLNGGTTTMTLGVQGVYRQANANTYFQMNKKTGYFKNTTALPGKITKIETTWSVAKGATKCYFANGAEATSSDATVTVSAGTSVTYTPDNEADYYFFNIDVSTGSGSAQMTSCVVYYEKAGGTPDPSISVTPSSWDFGTVHASAEASKVFSVSGSNLTAGDLTLTVPAGFSVSPSSIAVDGTLAATDVTVSKNTSDVDDYAGNLSITGGGLASAKTVGLTMTVDADPAPTGTFELFSGDIEEGDYVLVGYQTSSSKYYAMNSTVTSNQYLGITEVSIDANDQIVNPDASLVWTIEQSTNGYYIKQGSAYLDDNATSNKNYAQTVAEPTTTSEWAFAYDNTWTITNYGTETTKKTLSFNISASRVACYTAIQSGNTCFYLYKKVDGAVKPSAGLAFDAAQKLAKVAGTLTAPNLSTADGFDGTVTYASSDETVVKVNASTGAITEIVAAGKAVITAHSDETENFKEGSASYTIFVAEQAGTNEDPLTEASAKALIDNGCTLNAHVGGTVVTPTYYSSSHTYTVTLTDGFQFYKLKDLGNELFTSDYLKAGDQLVVLGPLGKHNTTYQLGDGCYLTSYTEYTAPKTHIISDIDNPITVAAAIGYIDDPVTYDLTDDVWVRGVVTYIGQTSGQSPIQYVDVKDADAENSFRFFNYTVNGSISEEIQLYDILIAVGKLDKHNTTYELNGCEVVDLDRPAVAVTEVTVESTASVAVGGTVTLHAAVVPENASNKTINWSVQSGNAFASVADGVVTGIAEGTAVIRAASDEDASIYAECTVTVAPLSPWASVYTSNIELSTEGGTSASAAKVKFYGEEGDGYDAIKAGTGSAQGAVVVNVPAGATALHFHAYGWTSESVGLTVTAPTGVTVSPATEISINSNSGIANNSPFTLAEGSAPQYDAYYAVSLSGNTEPVALTISATAGKRFVLFGVNQEGGLVLESIAVSGTASVLEYNDGDHFDPTGLVVTGHYSDDSEATISEGIDWTFDPDPLTQGTISVSVTATAGGFTSDAFVVNGLTVNGAAPLSPWATVYTSNITLSTEGGTSASAAKVKFYGEEGDGYDAIKAGTGSVQGAVVVNVPAGATALHFHAYSWNTEDVELTVTAPAGVTVTPSEAIAINKNSGIASNSPFTLAEGSTPQTDAYYALSLSGNTDATDLTFTATSGKRFVLFGVNQEGGILPVLQSIAISGDVTKKSGYKVGDEIDPAGLTVMATSTLSEVPQTPEDVTAKVAWSHDPLTEGQTEVTLTATYEGKTDNIVITLTEAVASADPSIYVSPSLYVNFGSVDKDAALPADQTITVTLTNVAAATATLGGTNSEAFSIDKTALVEGENVIIISVASTATAGEFSATITLTDNASAAPQKVVNLSFTVNEPVTPEDPEVRKTWDLSIASYDANPTEEQVTWSATYVNMVVDKYNATTKANNYLGGDANNRTSSRFYQNSKLTITPNGKEITSVVFTATSTSYANALQGSEWTNASASVDGTTVTVTPTDGKNAIIAVVGGTCGFTAVQVNYKNIAPEPPTKDLVRGGLSYGKWGTLCPAQTVEQVEGAVFYQISYLEEKDGLPFNMVFDEIEGTTLTAGKPYFFIANAEEIRGYKTGAVLDAAGDGVNGFYGWIGENPKELTVWHADYSAAENNTFVIHGNKVVRINQEGTKLPSERCYININSTEPSRVAVPKSPRRRISMSVATKDAAQGFENIESSDAPMKVMIEGTLYIIRGEKVFDATGRLVK